LIHDKIAKMHRSLWPPYGTVAPFAGLTFALFAPLAFAASCFCKSKRGKSCSKVRGSKSKAGRVQTLFLKSLRIKELTTTH
jgi:hypothetical protein